MIKKRNISVLGCGWLGLPLANKLTKIGFEVSGSTTTDAKLETLRENNIKPYKINLNPELVLDPEESFLDSEILIICFPPRLRVKGDHFFLKQMESLANQIRTSKTKKIIFTSSTSVYKATNETVTENDANQNHVLYQAEQILRKVAYAHGKKVNILRLSGLMGYERMPGKYFAGKEIRNGLNPVNYIHRDDAIGIITALVEQDIWSQTLNLTCPEHPNRQEVLEDCATKTEFKAPHFFNPKTLPPYKLVNGDKLAEILAYKFIYPSPLNFPY